MPDRRVCAFGARLTKFNVYNPRRGVLNRLPGSPYCNPNSAIWSPQRCLTNSSPGTVLCGFRVPTEAYLRGVASLLKRPCFGRRAPGRLARCALVTPGKPPKHCEPWSEGVPRPSTSHEQGRSPRRSCNFFEARPGEARSTCVAQSAARRPRDHREHAKAQHLRNCPRIRHGRWTIRDFPSPMGKRTDGSPLSSLKSESQREREPIPLADEHPCYRRIDMPWTLEKP